MSDIPNSKSFNIYIEDRYLAVAELSRLENTQPIIVKLNLPNSHETWYFFNRIRVPDAVQGRGYGTELIKQVISWADASAVNIYNPVNPYGRLDLYALRKFYGKYGFLLCPDRKSEMFRLHKNLSRSSV